MTSKPKKRHDRMTPQEKLAKARKKGYQDAMNDAADTVVYVMLYALRDKCGATDEQLHAFADAFPIRDGQRKPRVSDRAGYQGHAGG